MDVHLRIRRWVIWWFWLGVVCGAVAILNIVTRNLNRPQELIILFIGVMNWVLGGVICWAFGIHIVQPSPPASPTREAHSTPELEWHSASDFLMPGRRRLLPPKYSPTPTKLRRSFERKANPVSL